MLMKMGLKCYCQISDLRYLEKHIISDTRVIILDLIGIEIQFWFGFIYTVFLRTPYLITKCDILLTKL